jgi:hypothetical protein
MGLWKVWQQKKKKIRKINLSTFRFRPTRKVALTTLLTAGWGAFLCHPAALQRSQNATIRDRFYKNPFRPKTDRLDKFSPKYYRTQSYDF